MIDQYGRSIDYVRISLTDRCNLRCVYCMPEEGVAKLPHDQILTFDEILRICRALTGLGIRKVKLTGGEPLVRLGCASLIADLKALPGIEKVTLTTNGILLKEQLPELMAAGLDAVNISLDTMDSQQFAQVTRRGCLEDVLDGIRAALACPGLSVKINTVPVIEEPENLVQMAHLAKDHPLHVRFIEMMPIGYGREYPFRGEEAMVEILQQAYGTLHPIAERYGNGPCHYYEVEGFEGKIGFISAMSHKFCSQCNRVRLTSEGYMKACLQYQTGADLRTMLRNGVTDDQLTETIRDVIWNKPVSHNFHETATRQDEIRSMSQIGG